MGRTYRTGQVRGGHMDSTYRDRCARGPRLPLLGPTRRRARHRSARPEEGGRGVERTDACPQAIAGSATLPVAVSGLLVHAQEAGPARASVMEASGGVRSCTVHVCVGGRRKSTYEHTPLPNRTRRSLISPPDAHRSVRSRFPARASLAAHQACGHERATGWASIAAHVPSRTRTRPSTLPSPECSFNL